MVGQLLKYEIGMSKGLSLIFDHGSSHHHRRELRARIPHNFIAYCHYTIIIKYLSYDFYQHEDELAKFVKKLANERDYEANDNYLKLYSLIPKQLPQM